MKSKFSFINSEFIRTTFLMIYILSYLLSKQLQANYIDASHLFYAEAMKLADVYPKETEEEYLSRTLGVFQSIDRVPPQVGEVVEFNCYNVATMQPYKIKATLKKIGKHCYIYLENSQTLSNNVIEKIAYNFDEKIYPTCLRFFGDVWNPGIDGDPRITLLLMDIKDGYGVNGNKAYTSGYFNAMDEYSRRINPNSNMREMLYLDIYPTNPESDQFLGVIAHELQHMIHWNYDPKEHIWLNEAFSQLSVFLNGYGHPSQILAFVRNNDNNLIAWSAESTIENYGHVYLFVFYLMTRFSETGSRADLFLRSIVSNKKQGLESIDEVLRKFKSKYTIAQMFGGFCVANYINDVSIINGFYAYGKGLSGFRLPPTKKFLVQPFSAFSKVKLWSARGYLFDVSDYKNSRIKISFTGQKGNNNIFDLAFILIDSTKKSKPLIEWVRVDKYNLDSFLNIKIENHDILWMIVCHRGPIGRNEQKIAQMHHPAEFSFVLQLSQTPYSIANVRSNSERFQPNRKKSISNLNANYKKAKIKRMLQEWAENSHFDFEVFSEIPHISDIGNLYAQVNNFSDSADSTIANEVFDNYNNINYCKNKHNQVVSKYINLILLEEAIINELRSCYVNKNLLYELIRDYSEFYLSLDMNYKKKINLLHSKIKDALLNELKISLDDDVVRLAFRE